VFKEKRGIGGRPLSVNVWGRGRKGRSPTDKGVHYPRRGKKKTAGKNKKIGYGGREKAEAKSVGGTLETIFEKKGVGVTEQKGKRVWTGTRERPFMGEKGTQAPGRDT